MKVHPLSTMKKISPLQQIGTKLNKMANRHNANQRSAFAESAYAHATTQRSNRSSNNIMSYYEDDTAINHQDNIVQGEFQPLAGSSIMIIANTSSYDTVTDPRILALMEERESLGCAITSMGGQWIHKLEDGDRTEVTHAIWIGNEDDNEQIQQRQRQLSHLSNETLIKFNICQEKSIPIISPSWLDAIGEIQPGEHWSDVNMEEHIPRIIRLFNSHSEVKPQRNSLGSSRRDDSNKLSNSIKRTYESLLEEDPDLMEEEHIKRALEVSMLDFAIVHHTHTSDSRKSVPLKNDEKKVCPYDILQIDKDASTIDIKKAYRSRAVQTHPDKGGSADEFALVSWAYRILLQHKATNNGDSFTFGRDEDEEITLKSTAHWDNSLKEHRNLVNELYTASDQNIEENIQRQHFVLETLGLYDKDAGSQTYNEQKQLIRNSCFYLSLAVSYLCGISALAVWDAKSLTDIEEDDRLLLEAADKTLIHLTALQLKRVIEAAVISAHPEWATGGMVGENVQAFSDFLVYIESRSLVADWAVVIFDSISGFVDVYKGQHYNEEASNTLTLRYIPGHYQPLVVSPDSTRPTLSQIIKVLDESSVVYVITDGK